MFLRRMNFIILQLIYARVSLTLHTSDFLKQTKMNLVLMYSRVSLVAEKVYLYMAPSTRWKKCYDSKIEISGVTPA